MSWLPNTKGYYFKRYIDNQEIFKDNEKDKETFINENVKLLSKCIDPNFIDELEQSNSTGIAIGYIQSGKTSSMEAIANLARDNGFKIIIILSGTVGNLTIQTQERLFKTMRGIGWKRVYIPEAKRVFNRYKIAQDIVTALQTWENKHFNENEKRSVAIVSMKSTYRINKIFDIFNILKNDYNLSLSDIPTLIIDDECDHYSLNSLTNEENTDSEIIEDESNRRTYTGPEFYRVKEEDFEDNYSVKESISNKFNIHLEELNRLNPGRNFNLGEQIQISGNESATHRRIKSLRSVFNHHTYLGYTATPYASLLVSTFNNLSPDFAQLLTPGSNYTGAETFFHNRRDHPHINIFDNEEIAKLEDSGLMPFALKKAIQTFLIGVAIGINEKNKDHLKMKSRSMIVHSTALTGGSTQLNQDIPQYLCHEYFVEIINSYISKLKQLFAERNSSEFESEIESFKNCYNDIYEKSLDKSKIFPFDVDFQNLLEKSLYFTEVIEFNARQNETIPTIEWGEEGYARILVGGHGIERGYTVEGLTVSYMSRNPSRSIDTSMQRARFFGYHKNYIDLVRIFVSVNNNELYQDCFVTELNMRKSIKEHIDKGKPLSTWPRFFFSDRNQRYLPTRRSILGYELHRNRRNIQICLDSMAHALSNQSLIKNRNIYSLIVNDKNIKPLNSLYNNGSLREWIKGRDELIIENTPLEAVLDILKKTDHHDYNLMNYYSVKTLIEQYYEDNSENIICPIIIMKSKRSGEETASRTLTENGTINLHGGGLGEQTRIQDPNRYPGDNFMHYEFITDNTKQGLTNDQFPINIPTLQIYLIDVYLPNILQDDPISQKFTKINEDENSINYGKPYIENIPCFNFFTPDKIWRNIIYGTHR